MEHADGNPKHILVIDDDQDTVSLYHAILDEESYRVTVTASPALEPGALARLAPDLLLLDLWFGRERRGVTLLQRLKGDPATAQIPVLVCSADPRLLEELHAQLVAWDCAVLSKPFDLEAFLTTIQMCLARRPSPAAPDLAGQATVELEGDAPGRAGARPAAAGGTGDGAGSGGRSSSSLAGAGADPRRQRPEPRRPGGDRRRMLGRAGAERLADPAGDGRHLDPPDPTRARAVAGVGALLLRPPMDTAQQTEPTLSSPVRTPSPPCALGAVIKAERCRRGWSQEAFAARVVAHGDVSFRQSDVSRLERGAVALPRRERLRHIAAVLDLPLGALLARAGWEGAETIDAPAASPPEAAARPQQMTDDRAGRTPRPIVPVGGSRSWEAALREARVLLDQVQALLACCEPTRRQAAPAHDFGPDTDGSVTDASLLDLRADDPHAAAGPP